MSALVLFAHGSRDPDWALPFRAVQQKVAAERPELSVELAFLEVMQPPLVDTVAHLAKAGHARITIAPLFMAQGAHLKRDLANIVADLRHAHPHIELVLLPAAGEAPAVLEAVSAWLAGAA